MSNVYSTRDLNVALCIKSNMRKRRIKLTVQKLSENFTKLLM